MIALDNATAVIASLRRASAADVACPVEYRPLAELAPIADAWRDLASQALEPNVFYEPAFALAAAPALGGDVMAGLVWSEAPRRLAGFFPVRVSRRYGSPLAMLAGWTHAYAPLGTPLVRRDMAETVLTAWLGHVAGNPDLPNLMLLPFVGENGPFAAALHAVLARHSWPAAAFDRHQRALLEPRSRQGYLDRTLAAKRRRDLRRKQRLLAEQGEVRTVEARGSMDIAPAVEDFFRLEASGWKGRAGSAAAQHDGVNRFMRDAVRRLAAEGKASVYRLLLGGNPIAAAITLKSGGAAWAWKMAYDESYRACSPGSLLMAALTESLAADETIARTDSCATAEHLLMNQLWGERQGIADWMFALRADTDLQFNLAARLETLRRSAFSAAKNLRDLVRGA